MSPCPFCAEPIASEAAKCPHCGEVLRAEGACPSHPQRPIAGTCRSCAQYGCDQCLDVGRGTCLRCSGAVVGDAKAEYDLGKVITWFTKDPGWIGKVAIGAVCILLSGLLVPIAAFMGYKLRVARQQWGRPGEEPMPTWENLGELIVDGLKLMVAYFLLMLVVYGLFFGAMALFVGLMIAGAPPGGGGPPGPFAAVGVAGILVFYAFLFLFMIGFQYVRPAIELEYLETGSMTSGLHFRAIWRHMAEDPVEYLVLFAYAFLLNMLGSFGMFACYIGALVTIPAAQYCDGALLGRYLAKRDQDQRAARGALKPEA